ncbi:MAG TPA: MBL fold metallo-hydrolase [Cyclobacteriaceae bacterium]|nr:MBL fold metallo-hydrolase [Cyclobacteriaceae bacterium]
MKAFLTVLFGLGASMLTASAQTKHESDVFPTSSGELKITFIGHGTLMFEYNKLVIHVDPWSRVGDYDQLPKADIILVTHHHGDHLDKSAIDKTKKENTEIFLTQACRDQLGTGTVMKNGESKVARGISIEAVPAYNLVNKNNEGKPFHEKGVCNGYVLIFGGKRVYIAGDTENFPEMKDLGKIDIAFLPMNLPYTMTPEMVAEGVKMFNPKILYPYHYGSAADTDKLTRLLKDLTDCELRIRKF